MSGRGEGRWGGSIHTWLRGVLVIVAIAAVLGMFSIRTGPQRPRLGGLNVFGIVVMLTGLALALLSGWLARRTPEDRRDRVKSILGLVSVFVCCAGAMMVFL